MNEGIVEPQDLEDYDPDQIPPDWGLARKHAQSVRPGKYVAKQDEACPCCLNYIDKQPISLMEDNKELAFLGEGFPLFYNFLKFCMIMLFALIVDNSIINIYFNLSKVHCAVATTDNTHRLLGAVANSTAQLVCETLSNRLAYVDPAPEPGERRLVKIVAYCVQILLLLYFREKQSKLAYSLDERNCTMSDYTVFVEGLPRKSSDVKRSVTKMIQQAAIEGFILLDETVGINVGFGNVSANTTLDNFKTVGSKHDRLEVMDVLPIQDCKDFYELDSQLKQTLLDIKDGLERYSISPQDAQNGDSPVSHILGTYFEEYRSKKMEIQALAARMQQHQSQFFTGRLFIVMNSEHQRNQVTFLLNTLTKQEIIRYFPNYDPENCGKIWACEADEPKGIIWQNMHYTPEQRKLSLAMGWVLSILVLVVVTVAFFFLVKYKSYVVEEYFAEKNNYKKELEQDLPGPWFGYFIIILINLFNKFVYPWITLLITDRERHVSASSHQQSFALKYAIGMFFTTALMTLVVEAIIYKNYTHMLGVVEEETFMFMFNAFFPSLVIFFDPAILLLKIKRKLATYSTDNPEETDDCKSMLTRCFGTSYTQEEANQLMESPEYNMGKKYADTIKTMWFTFLYCGLLPVGPILSFFGILIYYCVDKYILLRRASVKKNISNSLARNMIKVLEFTLVLKPIGDILFNVQLRGGQGFEGYIMLGIGLCYLIIPWGSFLQFFFHQRFNLQIKKYSEVSEILSAENYSSLYPLRKYRQTEPEKQCTNNSQTQQQQKQQQQVNKNLILAKQRKRKSATMMVLARKYQQECRNRRKTQMPPQGSTNPELAIETKESKQFKDIKDAELVVINDFKPLEPIEVNYEVDKKKPALVLPPLRIASKMHNQEHVIQPKQQSDIFKSTV